MVRAFNASRQMCWQWLAHALRACRTYSSNTPCVAFCHISSIFCSGAPQEPRALSPDANVAERCRRAFRTCHPRSECNCNGNLHHCLVPQKSQAAIPPPEMQLLLLRGKKPRGLGASVTSPSRWTAWLMECCCALPELRKPRKRRPASTQMMEIAVRASPSLGERFCIGLVSRSNHPGPLLMDT